MKNQNFLNKLFTLIAAISGSIWLGAYATRMIISYQLFDIDMKIASYINGNNLESILKIISPSINTTFVLFLTFIIAFTIYLFTSNIKLKENGWMFITAVIIYTTLPFEGYLMIIDFKIISALSFSDIVNSDYVISLIRERFTSLGSFPIIILLSYCSLIYFLISKPFTLQQLNED
ncbi:MAG: hypothetical protein BMS9Abin39_0307 [Ignavibacteria bacterium]|nr:MAG: hypothetical protein BMS9Abin39_0307 [Ignavibacteria bacterium]